MRRPRRAAVGVLSPRRAPKLGKIRRRECLRLIPFPGTGDVLLAPTMISHPLAYVAPNPRQLEPGGCLTGETPASRSKSDTCDPLSYFGLQSVAAHIRVWCVQRCMVRCVHTVLPDERNRAAIMILAVGYLLVNRIIQCDKQRASTKATYQPLVKNS